MTTTTRPTARAARRRESKAAARRSRQERAVRSSIWREVALLLACAEIAIFVLVFDPSLRDVFDLPKAVYTHALAWVLLGVLVVVALVHGVRVRVSFLVAAFVALLSAEVLTTITASDRYVALYGDVPRFLGLTTHAVLALVAVAIAVGSDYPRRIGWLFATFAGLTVVSGVYAIQQALGADPMKWVDLDSRARPFATFGNPDFYGQYLAVAAMGAIALGAFAHGRERRHLLWIVVPLAALSVALMVKVATRGAFVGVVVAAVVLALLWLRREGLSRTVLLRFAIGGGVFAAAIAVVLVATPLGARLLQISEGIGLRDRVLLYESGIRMFLDHPLLGVGFENFAVTYPRYQQAEWFLVAGINTTNTSAHSWLLHTATTGGIVGLGALLVLMAAIAAHAWRRARDADAAPLLAAVVAMAAFYGSGLVLPGAQSIQWIPWACIGVALASDLQTARVVLQTPPLRVPNTVRIAVPAALAIVALTQLGGLGASRQEKIAESSLSATTATRAVEAARSATTTDPGRAVYWNNLGRALELISDLAGARDAYREATSRSPYTPAFWWNLARMEGVFAQQGDAAAKAATYDAMRRALDAGPENPETFQRFARIQYSLGDHAGALENMRRAVALYPTVAEWYTVAAEAAKGTGDTAASIELLRQGVAATNSNTLRLELARALMAAGNNAEARATLNDILRAEPGNAAASQLLAQIAGR